MVKTSPRKSPPDATTQWRVIKATLAAVLASVVGFGTVVAVFHHDSGEKRHQICDTVRTAVATDLPHELAISFRTDPDSPEVHDLQKRLLTDLEACD